MSSLQPLSRPPGRDVQLTVEAPTGERFTVEVPADTLLDQLGQDLLDQLGLRPAAGVLLRLERVDSANPQQTRRLDAAQSIADAELRDGDVVRVFLEAPAEGLPEEPPLPVSRQTPGEANVLRRYGDVSFPPRVPAGKPTNLRVRIVPQPRRDGDAALDLTTPDRPGPVRVTVSVAAENFTIEGDPRAVLVVPPEGESLGVAFRLTGQRVGGGRVMLDFDQDGRPVGSVDLWPEVVGRDAEAFPVAATRQRCMACAAVAGPLPDVTLTVHTHHYSPRRLHFSLSSRDIRLRDLPFVTHGDLRTIDLPEEIATWVDRQLTALRTTPGSAGDEQRLIDLGHRIYRDALPEPVQRLCWDLAERGVRSVMVVSDDPHIPWELIKPFRPAADGAGNEELPFWGENFALTRWLRGPATTGHFVLERVWAVAPWADAPAPQTDPSTCWDPRLSAAAQEVEVVRSLQSVGARVDMARARCDDFAALFDRGEFDLLHVASHSRFGGAESGDASILLLEDGAFRAGELPPRVAAVIRRRAPLIFFNACHTGRLGYSLTRLSSWGGELVQMGCGGFVGTLWRVGDQGALLFAQEFYTRLMAGDPIGEALLAARLRVRAWSRTRNRDDCTWLAYCCFADPMARLEKLAGSPEVP